MAKLALIQKWNPSDHGASSTEGTYLPYLQTKYLVHLMAWRQQEKEKVKLSKTSWNRSRSFMKGYTAPRLLTKYLVIRTREATHAAARSAARSPYKWRRGYRTAATGYIQ